MLVIPHILGVFDCFRVYYAFTTTQSHDILMHLSSLRKCFLFSNIYIFHWHHKFSLNGLFTQVFNGWTNDVNRAWITAISVSFINFSNFEKRSENDNTKTCFGIFRTFSNLCQIFFVHPTLLVEMNKNIIWKSNFWHSFSFKNNFVLFSKKQSTTVMKYFSRLCFYFNTNCLPSIWIVFDLIISNISGVLPIFPICYSKYLFFLHLSLMYFLKHNYLILKPFWNFCFFSWNFCYFYHLAMVFHALKQIHQLGVNFKFSLLFLLFFAHFMSNKHILLFVLISAFWGFFRTKFSTFSSRIDHVQEKNRAITL